MGIYESKTWNLDLETVADNLPELEELNKKEVLVTGASGLIGSAVVDLLIKYNEKNNANIIIKLAGRSEERMKNRFLPFWDKPYIQFVFFDSSAASDDDSQLYGDFVIHCASNASPSKIMNEPVETMLSNIMGAKRLLDQAMLHNTARVLFVSSSEVYGSKNNDLPFSESEYGYIDLLCTRNSYSVGKRAAETLCASYSEEYGVNFAIARPGHIYGPTAVASDNRVSSVWARAVADGEDIVMKSEGKQIRSYCYCLDCASAILKILLRGATGKAYNISNPQSIISIKELANILAKSAGVEVRFELPTESEKRSFNPMTNSSLNSESLLSLGWLGAFDAYAGIDHTVRIIRESM